MFLKKNCRWKQVHKIALLMNTNNKIIYRISRGCWTIHNCFEKIYDFIKKIWKCFTALYTLYAKKMYEMNGINYRIFGVYRRKKKNNNTTVYEKQSKIQKCPVVWNSMCNKCDGRHKVCCKYKWINKYSQYPKWREILSYIYI